MDDVRELQTQIVPAALRLARGATISPEPSRPRRKNHGGPLPWILLACAGLVGVGWVSACGGGATAPSAHPPITPPRATTVAVTPASAELSAVNTTVQLHAEVRDQDGRTMADASVVWMSGSTTVATVSAAGLVTAVANGTATITAMAGSASGSATVTVAQEVRAVNVTPTAGSLVVGDTLRLAADAFDENGHSVPGAEFRWSSSDLSVARVDGAGLVTGAHEGMATITAATGDASGASDISVENPDPANLDRAALVALYDATDGENWANNENWLTDRPLNQWYGIATDEMGRVVALHLADNGLAGPIPVEMEELTRLKWLYISGKQLGWHFASGARCSHQSHRNALGRERSERSDPGGVRQARRSDVP